MPNSPIPHGTGPLALTYDGQLQDPPISNLPTPRGRQLRFQRPPLYETWADSGGTSRCTSESRRTRLQVGGFRNLDPSLKYLGGCKSSATRPDVREHGPGT